MTDRPRQRDNLVVRGAGNEVAVFDPSTGTLVQLNATALAIWQACDGQTTLEEIVQALVLLTGRTTEGLEKVVATTVGALTDQGLLERE